jgi:tetratricopeptide (TPR) repeat protein
LPLVGLTVALAVILRSFGHVRRQSALRWSVVVAGTCVILLLIVAATRQVRVWRNDLSVWENAVRIFPESHVANQKLADALVQSRQYDRAFYHYQTALKLNVFDVKAAHRFARALAACSDQSRRDYDLAHRLAEWAWELTEGKDPAVRRTLAIVRHNAADALRQRGEYQQAIDGYRQSIEADATYPTAVFNLALLLATCSDGNLQDPEEAVRVVERAGKLVERLEVNTVMITALVYDKAGQRDKAISTMERAISAAEAAGDIESASMLRGRLNSYRSQSEEQADEK